MFKIVERKLKVNRHYEMSVGVLLIGNVYLVILADDLAKLNALTLSAPMNPKYGGSPVNSTELFSVNPRDDLSSKIIGDYLAKRVGKPVIVIAVAEVRNMEMVKSIVDLLADMLDKRDFVDSK